MNRTENGTIITNKIKKSIEMTKNLELYLRDIKSENRLIYISPEQTGRLNVEVDYRSDYYSLGVMLFHLFTGEYPFSHPDPMQLVYAHIAVVPPPISSIDPNLPLMLSSVVRKLLSKNPDERYQSRDGIISDLEYILNNPNKAFLLARKDVITTLRIPKKLYGREIETHNIKEAILNGQKELIALGGYSGIGKSALIENIKEQIKDYPIYFSEVKFEQQKKVQTFNAISAALTQYLKMVLLKDEIEIEDLKNRLLEDVGENIQLIIDFIPELKAIIPEEFSVGKLHPNEAQNRFNITFVKFLQVISSFNEKIVLFIDDMQWSDVATIRMVELILSSSDISNIVILLSYRNNEIKSSHPFAIMLHQFEKNDNCISLELTPLQQNDIESILQDTFSSSSENLHQFASLLNQKTGGNPFFIKELLHNLANEKLLTYDLAGQLWSWDIDKIRQTKISDNVVDIVAKKIDQASPEIKDILKYIALFGSEFDIQNIADILDTEPRQLQGTLMKYQYLNFVIQSGASHYKFAHDKIQEAFVTYLSEDEKKAFHLKTGEYLLKHSQNLFKITNHLNSAKELITEKEKRYELIELNHKCAQEAFKSNSYTNAIYYLLEAIHLQDKNRWKNDYRKSVDLNTLLSEVYYLNLEFDKAKESFDETLKNTTSLKDKIKIIQIEIFSFIAQNKMKEALDLGLNILEQFGIEMPKTDDMGEYYPKLFNLYDVNDIALLQNLPEMQDEEKLHIIDILNSIMAPAYLTAPHIYPKICYVAINQCIIYGNSAAATNVYAVHALLLSAFFNEFKQSYEFAKLAQKLIEMYNAKAYIAKVEMIANACVTHWNGNVKNTLKPLHDTVIMGIEVGDFEYACYSGMYYTLYSLLSGKEIGELKQDFNEQSKMMHSLKQSYQFLYSSVWQEFLENLTQNRDNTSELEGTYFSEKESLQSLINTNSFSILYNLYFAKSILGLLYEDIDKAYHSINTAKNYHIGVASLYQFGEFFFYEAIIAYRYHKLTNKSNREEVVKLLQGAIDYYTMLSLTSRRNNEHKRDLLKALLGELQGDVQCWKQIQNAAKKAKESEFVHLEAIINQFGFYYWSELDMHDFADTYLQKSLECYRSWGATTVAEHLQKKYTSTLAEVGKREQIALEAFDLNTVIKASHILAQEFSLNELLKKMMDVILENSASQNAYLFLETNGSLQLAAGYKENTFLLTINESELPIHIVNYVRRTREEVIYSAKESNDFIRKDYYVRKNQPKSIFCMPIHYHGELRGVLYLENRDILNLYSKKKADLLRLLSNQAAISIEHVKLFEEINQINSSLEEQVTLRTKELQEQKEIFERLFYDTSDGVLLIKNGKFTDCNNAAVSMLKYTSKESLLNIHPSDISPLLQADGNNSLEKSNDMIALCLQNGSHRFEWIHKKANGESFWVDVSLTAIKMAGENAIHVLWKDITKQKELEENLLEAKDKAESATKQKSEFLANMSHEIRTPMNGIIGMTHLALQAVRDNKQKDYLKKIDNSAKSLLGIINDILDFSKIEAGKLFLDKIDFDLFKTVDAVIGLIELKAHEKNLELIVSYGADIGKNFHGDSLRISQILTNLMSNAVKFTSKGEIGVYIHRAGNDRFRFEVKDTGIGIEKEVKNRLFKSFSQADGSTTRKYGGTGLGLAISKQLVELMNGKIWVESEVGRGSSFIFEIELKQIENTHKTYKLFQDKKVLIVDDNQTWQEVLANLLHSFEIDADLVDSGELAIKQVDSCKKHYDLILMDWNMPHLDGIETTKIIKEQCKGATPPTVIMVSSFRQESIVKLAKDVGIDIFLQKPINPSILNDILSAIFLEDIQINYTHHFEENSLKYNLTTLKGSKILLVEDNSTNQEIIQGLLENSGILIDIANNGKEAVEMFDASTYELILMDLQMPIMDGYEATEQIRAKDEIIPILALTANAMKEDLEKTRDAKMNEHLNKPIEVEKLYATLLKYIAKKCDIKSKENTNEEPMLNDLEFKYINVQNGLSHMAGNEKLYIKILGDFARDHKNLNLEALDEERFKRETHTIKGLSANIGATQLHEVAQKLDETGDSTLLPLFYDNLEKVLDEIEELLQKEYVQAKIERVQITKEKRDELFEELKIAIASKRPHNCELVLNEIEKCKLVPEDQKLFFRVKNLIAKYRFKEANEELGKEKI